ncbi:isoprenylcysteine carboxylmethyltransferase family protein [Sphingomicrobium sp. XHP0239]|uniref:methyltransferase family protein n=1 Tax=Sphingomicrobium maritimum TaxID=3133972 RepID=UPI0031CCA0FD
MSEETDLSSEDTPGVIAPPPLIFGVPLVLGIVFHKTVGGFDLPLYILSWPVRAFGGAAVAIVGAAFIATALWQFRRAETPPEPWEPTRALTFAGPYRLTRNPMDLGMAFIYFGITLIAGCLVMLAFLIPVLFVVDRFVIAREEAYLSRRFGRPYRDYQARSRRWL